MANFAFRKKNLNPGKFLLNKLKGLLLFILQARQKFTKKERTKKFANSKNVQINNCLMFLRHIWSYNDISSIDRSALDRVDSRRGWWRLGFVNLGSFFSSKELFRSKEFEWFESKSMMISWDSLGLNREVDLWLPDKEKIIDKELVNEFIIFTAKYLE